MFETNQINQSVLKRTLHKYVSAASSTVRGAVRRIGCLSEGTHLRVFLPPCNVQIRSLIVPLYNVMCR